MSKWISLKPQFFIETSILLKLAFPLILAGLMQGSVGFFSTLFLAHLGYKELAAGAIVASTFATLMVVMWGILTAVSVLIAHKHGEKDNLGIAQVLRGSLLLALVMVIPAFLIIWNTDKALFLIGQDTAIISLAQKYMHALAWGILPDFVSIVLIQFLIGLGHTRSNLVFSLFWVPLTLLCNYLLVFGKLGLPALGIAGIGWGTTISYWISTLLLIVYLLLNKNYRIYLQKIFHASSTLFIRELLRTGVPMGLMFCIEVAFFLIINLLMGFLGTQLLAANQIAVQYLGQLSVVSFCIAQAITVRMGHTLGAKEVDLAKQAAYSGVFIAVVFMSIVAVCYWFIPDTLIAIDLNIHDPKNTVIIKYVKEFFVATAFFQLIEAVRIALFGALRGLKDTRFTLLTSLISFWIVSLPLGYLCAIKFEWGATWLWWGGVIGMVSGAILLHRRFVYKIQQW